MKQIKYICKFCGGHKIKDENNFKWDCEYCQSKNNPIEVKTK